MSVPNWNNFNHSHEPLQPQPLNPKARTPRMELSSLRVLAIPSVCFLIAFLAYGSQLLFCYLEPGPLTKRQTWLFNSLVAAIWFSYERACRVDPGRLPTALNKRKEDIVKKDAYQRWCQKCDAPKPPRVHHCKQCGRCIPKMDHHCPWTANCVSATTFPHFLRFVLYACISLAMLDYHLYNRGYAIYEQRDLPSYLGPSKTALVFLSIMLIVTNLVLFALSILLVTAAHSLLINTTMIETWEIERHEALVGKSKDLGGHVNGPGGIRVRIKRQEFPYDIGFWANVVQGMGTNNPLAWILPFGGSPDNKECWVYETNGFEDEGDTWPPVDPDKMARPFVRNTDPGDNHVGDIAAFKKRQQADMARWQKPVGYSVRMQEMARATVVDDEGQDVTEGYDEDHESEYEEGIDGEEGWTSRDGSRLRDFGVDEDADIIAVEEEEEDAEDEDDIPLGELIRRRKANVFKNL